MSRARMFQQMPGKTLGRGFLVRVKSLTPSIDAKYGDDLLKADTNIEVSPGVNLHVLVSVAARPTHLPTLIPIHFWGGSSKTWAAFNAKLRDDFNIVTPSLRGWGKSSKPSDPKAYRTVDYAADIVAMVRYLRKNHPMLTANGIILVGHSLGGKIAQSVLTFPEMQPLVRKLVLVGSSPASGSEFSEEMKEKMAHVFDSVETAQTAFTHYLLGRRASDDAQLVRSLAEDAVRAGPEAAVAFPRYGCAEDIEAEVKDAVRQRKQQGQVLKVAVVEGSERPEDAEAKVVNVLAGAGAVVTFQALQCGHLIPVEAPAGLAKLVKDFAQQVS